MFCFDQIRVLKMKKIIEFNIFEFFIRTLIHEIGGLVMDETENN
jgi:hypothetical protein